MHWMWVIEKKPFARFQGRCDALVLAAAQRVLSGRVTSARAATGMPASTPMSPLKVLSLNPPERIQHVHGQFHI
jgi:hypothetical protein